MPEVLHRVRQAIRRGFRHFEDHRSDEPPYIATWTLSFQVAVGYDDLDDMWVAECLDLPGCMSQGDTEEAALENLQDAIKGVMMVIVEQQVTAGQAAVAEARQHRSLPVHRDVKESQLDMKIALGA